MKKKFKEHGGKSKTENGKREKRKRFSDTSVPTIESASIQPEDWNTEMVYDPALAEAVNFVADRMVQLSPAQVSELLSATMSVRELTHEQMGKIITQVAIYFWNRIKHYPYPSTLTGWDLWYFKAIGHLRTSLHFYEPTLIPFFDERTKPQSLR